MRWRWRAPLTVALVCGLLWSPGAGAQTPAAPPASQQNPDANLSDLPLEDLLDVKVYAASRFLQDTAQAPASVTVVTSDEIRRHGYRTLAEILRGVRGFYVTYDRDYSYVGVRGFQRPGDYNGRVLLLVNGHRLNDTIFEQALLGTESPLDVGLFDRVEVIRGPSSSLYGTSAFFAVINVITRTGRDVGGAEVEVGRGSQALSHGRLTAGGRTARGVEGMLSIAAMGSDGNRRIHYPVFDTDGGDGVAVNADGDRSANLFASGTAGGFTGQIGFGTRTKHVPTAPFGTIFNDARTETRDVRGFADLRYTRRLDPGTTLELRAGYDHYVYSGAFAYDTGLFKDDGRGEWLTSEALLIRQAGRHAVTIGAEVRSNLRQNQSARDATGVLLDDHRRSEAAALFVEDEIRVHPRVLVNAGLRWDEYFGIFGGTVNPRVAFIVTPRHGSTVKALYGRAFRAPNPFELYYDQSALSAQLEPETIQTFELAWEQRVGARMLASVSAFRNHVRSLITQRSGSDDTLDGLYYRNGDSVTADGVEVELQGELPGRAHVRVAQVVQEARLDTLARRISNSPRLLSTIVADAPLAGTNVTLALHGYYIGNRRRVVAGTVSGAFVAGLSLSYRPHTRPYGASLVVSNLFNTAYSDPGSVEHRQDALPQDGRTAAVNVVWRF